MACDDGGGGDERQRIAAHGRPLRELGDYRVATAPLKSQVLLFLGLAGSGGDGRGVESRGGGTPL